MKRFIYCLFALLICFLPITTSADEKNFSITDLNIHCDINNNGDLLVTQELIYDFKGSFNGVYINLTDSDNTPYEVYGVAVKNGDSYSSLINNSSSNNNSYQLIKSDNKTQVKIFCKSANEKKSFLLKYKIKSAAKKYEDYSELYWNFFNVTDNKVVTSATLTISLIEGTFDLNKLKYTAYVNGDFSTESNSKIIKISGHNLSEKLGIKLQFQQEFLNIPISKEPNTINKTQGYDPSLSNNDDSNAATGIIMIFLVIAAIVGYYLYSNEKNKKLFNEEVAKYRGSFSFFNKDVIDTPPNDLSPALVSLLYDEDLNNIALVPATLFYLAKKGYYSISIDENNSANLFKTIFIRNKSMESTSSLHLNTLIEWFSTYEVDGKFNFNELKDIISDKKSSSFFSTKHLCFINDVRLDASNLNFYTKIHGKELLSNKAYNEKLKWIAYRKFLLSHKNIPLGNSQLNYNLIYGTALKIDSSINDDHEFKSDHSFNNTYDQLFFYSYYTNLGIFNDIHEETNRNTNESSFNAIHNDNSSGFSDSSDFSGGGGSDSGAF